MSADAYAVVWRPGSGAQWWRSGMSYDQFKAQDKTYFDQNLRLTSLAIREGRYAALWRPGAGAQWWKPGMSYAEFKSQDKDLLRPGAPDRGARAPGRQVHSRLATRVGCSVVEAGHVVRGVQVPGQDLLRPGAPHLRAGDREREVHGGLASGNGRAVVEAEHVPR